MKNLYISGIPSDEGQIQNHQTEFSFFETILSVKISRQRSTNQKIKLNHKTNDIAHIVFEDDTEWLGNINDVHEIFGDQNMASRSDNAYHFPEHIEIPDNNRDGLVRKILIKFFNLFRPKSLSKVKEKLAQESALLLAKHFDKKLMPEPGLFQVNASLEFNNKSTYAPKEGKQLLIIHGAFSSTKRSFEGLISEKKEVWNSIYENYNGGIWAYDHYSLSVSPMENALDLIKKIKDNSQLDILSSSRGGIVADILAKCDRRNEVVGFSDQELKLMAKEDELTHLIMLTINKIARKKNLSINKIIRVACPASGTTLLSRRLDHFLNAILHSVGLAFGSKGNVVYSEIKSFLLEVLNQKQNPQSIPGLWAMTPESVFQKILNNPENHSESELFIIDGSVVLGPNPAKSMAVILSNLFYWQANDFIVDTQRMSKGVRRTKAPKIFSSSHDNTSHFNYFKNQDSRQAIQKALLAKEDEVPAGFKIVHQEVSDRGIILKSISYGEAHSDNISGNRPIAILIPGIMGSNLYAGDEKIWLNLEAIHKGKIRSKLKYNDKTDDNSNIKAKSLVGKYYSKLLLHLKQNYDVLTFAYDWRKSLAIAAEQLNEKLKDLARHNQPIKIIAHSMGGLLVRQVILDFPTDWKKFIQKKDSRFLMLGTPWYGSYGVMQVFTGQSSMVNLLSNLDLENSKSALMDVFNNYEGLFQLLPIDNNEIESESFWKKVKNVAGVQKVNAKFKKQLENFEKYKFIIQHKDFDLSKNCFYIAGQDKITPFDFKIETRFFQKHLIYLGTQEGDGSVTWEMGIPRELPKKNTFYALTVHGELANDEKLFKGISEILNDGNTNQISKNPALVRSKKLTREVYDDYVISNKPEQLIDQIFGINPQAYQPVDGKISISVGVTNGHLKVSEYPVLVGHFNKDGIVSAEKAIDYCLNGRLTERHRIGYYPGKVGESEVVFNLRTNPKGAIIIGLGEVGNLTSYKLSKSVQNAILRYAIFMRDNYSTEDAQHYATGITSLLVGSGYGMLQIEDSIRGIITGISNANQIINNLGSELKPIQNLEFIDYYEELSQITYYRLSNFIKSNKGLSIRFSHPGIAKKYGSRKKQPTDTTQSWWHNFSTKFIQSENEGIAGLNFTSSSGLARIEEKTHYNGIKQVEILLNEIEESTKWDKKLSKAIFEILIPNNFKEIIRNQNNILWKLDNRSAEFPWEMFHDFNFGEDPTFVNSGLIRQLYAEDYRENPNRTKNKHAFIVGDPIYNVVGLSQLPAAQTEARGIQQSLEQNDFTSQLLLGSNSAEILKEFYNTKSKIMHFAGHGLYEPEFNPITGEKNKNRKIGIAIGDGMILDAGMFEQLSDIPEFVFINCCYSGKINATDEKYFTNRYKLAANIGVQLIRIGVKAVVMTGWAIDDATANEFAQVFYNNMMIGHEFGKAVQLARKAAFQFSNTNTWGAYQCYGDQFYQMVKKSVGYKTEEYVIKNQAYIDLDNLFSEIEQSTKLEPAQIEKLENIIDNVERNNLMDSVIVEKQAKIFSELNLFDQALDKYESLLDWEKAEFSVKALESYINLLSKKLVNSTEPVTEIEINKLLNRAKEILQIGKTQERLIIMGNAYKRAAQVSTEDAQISHLKNMKNFYLEAYKKSNFRLSKEFIFPLCNYITSVYLLKHLKVTEQLPTFTDPKTGKDIKLIKALQNYEREWEGRKPSNRLYNEDMAPINIQFCLLLLQWKGAEELGNKIQELYGVVLNNNQSRKKISAEIEHVKFLLSFNLNKSKDSALKQVLSYLEGLI